MSNEPLTADLVGPKVRTLLSFIILVGCSGTSILAFKEGHTAFALGWVCLGVSMGVDWGPNHPRAHRLLIVKWLFMAAALPLMFLGVVHGR
jgi:hypothetical protein